MEPAAETAEDADRTTFWLVVADQLHRRGIDSPATERAVSIIDAEANLRALADLGMSEVDLRTRERQLRQLRDRLTGPLPDKSRQTLKNPAATLRPTG